MNSNRRGHGDHPWQITAFADRAGLRAADTSKPLWPIGDWSPELLAAVLNGPVANAYVATHATGRQITDKVVLPIPLPKITPDLKTRIERLVDEYTKKMSILPVTDEVADEAKLQLLHIDAAVLSGYKLPPRLERKLLDYFNGHGSRRPVGYPCDDYFPSDFTPFFTLEEYISPTYQRSTADGLLKRWKAAPQEVLDAFEAANEAHAE